MKTKYKYIEFVDDDAGDYACQNKKSGYELGFTVWHQPWQQYVFIPSTDDVIFSADCLRDIAHFLEQLNKERNG